MKFEGISRDATFFSSPLIEAYLNSDILKNHISFFPGVEGVSEAVKEKSSFPQDRRDTLVEDLLNQYHNAKIDLDEFPLVKKNILKLKNENTFTITTGQQIHIGLGPMYVLYKIWDTLSIVKQLNTLHKDQYFVPMFWMASEDHDLEEIASISYFKETKIWRTDQSGAVGRMHPGGIAELFQSFIDELNWNEIQLDFLTAAKLTYEKSETLSVAFRKLLHQYTCQTGLVIIDPDRKLLKKEFCSVMVDELNHKNGPQLERYTNQLESIGFRRQLKVRSCNLFLLENNNRIRIDDIKSITKKDVATFVNENYANLSPNAALRPLYQEWILPNVCYVGGAGELNYWLQLKGLFDNYSMAMPSFHLRTSCVLLPPKIARKSADIGFDNLFKSDKKIALLLNQNLAELDQKINTNFEKIKTSISEYDTLVNSTLKGFKLDSKWGKLQSKLNEIQSLVDHQFQKKLSQTHELDSILKIQKVYFNPESIQERIDHIGIFSKQLKLDLKTIERNFGFQSINKVLLIIT